MAGTISLFNHRSMSPAVKLLPEKPSFLRTKIFKEGKTHPTREVDLAQLTVRPKMAPFIQVGDEGILVSKDVHDIKSVAFPKIRLKSKYTGLDLEKTSINNPVIYVDSTPQQQMIADINDQQQKLKDMCNLRKEWMCAKLLTAGGFTYSHDGVYYKVDYGRDTDNVFDVNTDWGTNGATPLKDFRSGYELCRTQGSSGVGRIAVFGSNAYDLFMEDETVLAKLDTLNLKMGTIEPVAGEQYFGRINGVDCYVYSDNDTDGNPFIPANAVVFIPIANEYVIDYGPVHEKEGLIQTDWFSKGWDQEEPPGRFICVETNPLPLARDIDGIVVMYAVGRT
ncbi:MAG: major capsid protein [Candidatus Eremiobacterota bacterium]